MKNLAQILGDASVKNVNNFLANVRPTNPNPDGSPIYLKNKRGTSFVKVLTNDNCWTAETEEPVGINNQTIGDYYLNDMTYILSNKDEYIEGVFEAQAQIDKYVFN